MAPTSMKLAGKVTRPLSTADGDHFIFQRLTQYLQDCMTELRQFIQEKHSVVAQADFTRFRPVPSSHQPGIS